MPNHEQTVITGDMLVRYYELNKRKKEIELEMNGLKEVFQDYLNHLAGFDQKAEITISGYKLQRQIRKTEKYKEEETVKKLEEMQLNDLIQVVKKPDDQKIKAALSLGLVSPDQLDGCIVTTISPAISVKPLTPR
ncbi:hypothetical protein [Neobacillus sp. Marseille-QA0830]